MQVWHSSFCSQGWTTQGHTLDIRTCSDLCDQYQNDLWQGPEINPAWFQHKASAPKGRCPHRKLCFGENARVPARGVRSWCYFYASRPVTGPGSSWLSWTVGSLGVGLHEPGPHCPSWVFLRSRWWEGAFWPRSIRAEGSGRPCQNPAHKFEFMLFFLLWFGHTWTCPNPPEAPKVSRSQSRAISFEGKTRPWSSLRALPLTQRIFVEKPVVLAKRQNGFTTFKTLSPCFPGFSTQGMVFVHRLVAPMFWSLERSLERVPI